ncbi:hypothetical protein, partial [Aeromonas sp. QDB56]|uniref:hypothetical protein n=2 Tax=unclassified Aeromonas TaxID=257493 RepID=UPI0022E4FB2E
MINQISVLMRGGEQSMPSMSAYDIGTAPEITVTRTIIGKCEKSAVGGLDVAKPDRLTRAGIFPAKPSQTFSRDPARTSRDNGLFTALAGRNGANGPFSLVKMPIEHNGDYARRFLGRSCSVLRSP